MCGISGIVSFDKAEAYESSVLQMNDALAHRGPNAQGIWKNHHVVLGHRRLSIIDLSAAGNQPMGSADGRFVLVYNGEIFNYRELREELSEYPFATRTDSEVIIAAYLRWGMDCMHHFNGMFAFALWDNQTQKLFLVRDRLGVKPLYYYMDGQKLVFASEIRSILASGVVSRKLDEKALVDYLRYQTVHAPNTIIRDIKMLMPGQFMLVQNTSGPVRNTGNKRETTVISFAKYQVSFGFYWKTGESNTITQSPQGKSKHEIEEDIQDLLSKAVERRLVADVPFGAFLSGGIDSSILVGLMAGILNQPVNTFSVTFTEKRYSESTYSRMIAKKFNTRHNEIQLTPDDFLGMLPAALHSMDHPSGDGPNTWVVSKVTKDAGITMALSGLGGDELFAGYGYFKRLYRLHQHRYLAKFPNVLKQVPVQLLGLASQSASVFKMKEILQLPSWNLVDSYPISRMVLPDERIVQLLAEQELPPNAVQLIVGNQCNVKYNSHFLSAISCAEMNTYMQNVLLRDTDQMSMAHALEVRVPFLDYALVEYVLQVRDSIKYPESPKQLLVASVKDLLPEGFNQRPKMGFTLPWTYWMQNELKSFCESRLQWLAKFEYFNSMELKLKWERFLANDPLITWSRIWALVALGDWLKTNDIN